MRKSKLTLFVAALVMLTNVAFAQGIITGTVKDASTGEKLVGVNVVIDGTTKGVSTGINGQYKLNVSSGPQSIVFSFIGYDSKTIHINLKGGENREMGDVMLDPSTIGLSSIEVIADRARERETPVAFSTMKKQEIEEQLGSRDIPLVLNTTPSVYSTMQGGGAGDARINVRGFDQRNIAIMINGVPVNDMENGWVYWSNWDGVGDATSSIQMQRGLSAVNLATPSIGGTMNIITDPSQQTAGLKLKQEVGSDGFLKTTLMGHTGLINGKYAFSAGGVRKTGDGVIDATWTDAWAYYFAASYNLNENNRFELYALGAPQRHGQNLYKQNIAAYSHDFAKDLDSYDEEALDEYSEAESGRLYNQNWSPVNPSYSGDQWWNGAKHDRYASDFINERENFYHKPQVNLNWYHQYNDKLNQYTIVYYSGGKGGGTGTYGSMAWDYSGPSRVVDYNATISNNTASDTAHGILRNSRNNQWTIGAISKLKYKINDNLTTQIGLDWRTAEIEHFREVRDLLGGQFYYYDGNEFDAEADYRKGLGDKIAYFNTNTVDWAGAYAQAELKQGPVTAYGMFGYSAIKYSYTDEFRRDPENSDDKFMSESDWISGYQLKGGASYKFTQNFNIFGNAGYVAKVPIFDNVINDYDGTVAENPEDEKFIAFELGAQYTNDDNTFNLKANLYHTSWRDRAKTIGVQDADGDDDLITLSGMDQLHQGFEMEANYRPVDFIQIDAMASIGNWTYTDDVSGTYKDYSAGASETIEYNYYVKDLKVGDAPQTQFAAAVTLMPVTGLRAEIIGKHYRDHHSSWDPFSRTNPDDKSESWTAPEYTVFDLHASYDIPFDISGVNFEVFAHVFNLFDTEYIQDATDNSRYNGFDGDHDGDDAEVFFGLPRMFNVGLTLTY